MTNEPVGRPETPSDAMEPVSTGAPGEPKPAPHTFVETRYLAAVADTTIRHSYPYRNEGWETVLEVGSPFPYRTLVGFEPDAIRFATKNRDLESSTLRLLVDESDSSMWKWGRVVNLYRMTQEWSELGATWDCADDTNPANNQSDCPEDKRWGMSGRDRPIPWVSEAVASASVGFGHTGFLSFDVTEDLNGFLAGKHPHFGWILRKRGDMRKMEGSIAFASGETGNPAVLALTVSCPDDDDDTVCSVEDNCPDIANTDQLDLDRDGMGDSCDEDDDNDLVADLLDPEPLNADICGDSDGDTCDDCSVAGHKDPANDGEDTDADGICDAGDPAKRNPRICGDLDGDTCDDCRIARRHEPANDGKDSDLDGLCDAGDPDDDNDLVPDRSDPDRYNPRICGDLDRDTCDDCSVTLQQDPANDGMDTDMDGLCNAGDPDDDNDSIPDTADPDNDNDLVDDVSDPHPMNPAICGDADADTCDDCAVANRQEPLNDGEDTDADGICDAGDPDDDNDGVPDDADPMPWNPAVCGDSDGDTCDDCAIANRQEPLNDGPDSDADGICDAKEAGDGAQ